VKLILTHPNADFDAVASTLAAHKLYPDAIPVLSERLNRNVDHFMLLYHNGFTFIHQQDLPAKGVERVILVDTQRLPSVRGVKNNTPLDVIDHHQPFSRDDLPTTNTFLSEPVGATTTLLVERMQQQEIRLTSLEATLLMLGIYEDTGSLSYGTTTPRDIRAAAWLLEQNAALDTVRRFLAPPLKEEQQALYDKLIIESESRDIDGHVITVGAAKIDSHLSEISSVVHRLRDTLDSSALFVVVKMPDSLLLVCRSTADSIDVGEIARYFGGGGHARAAAATIYDKSLNEVVVALWQQIRQHVRPMTRVADLMSYSIQTLDAGKHVSEIIQHIRRIGHEGFPVLENGRVVGLLTRRDADRAMEHGLGNLTLREIMSSGEVTLRPDDSVPTLEQRMVESGWGQIPVLDDQERLIGIVTRTDLIKHWAHTHPVTQPAQNDITFLEIADTLGSSVTSLIEKIASQAEAMDLRLYMVGGVVRDLLLKRPNLDIDFVVETNAIELASALQARYGGEVHSFQPFGTAKWVLDAQTATALKVDAAALPAHIDFATARNEFYEHPTALPTVYSSSIKLDLQRRDFTINTLAVQLSPPSGQILDFYGGMNDLRDGLIRVLHSLSLVEDPTRILRAVRFERRLKFTIEPRTAELIDSALPMLRRITGERIRNELDWLLRENEPEQALLNLQKRGALEAIHPAFRLHEQIATHFQAARGYQTPWPIENFDLSVLYWHIIASAIDIDNLPDWCERLLFGRKISDSLIEAARLIQQIDSLTQPDMRPSQIVERLDDQSEMALLTGWLLVEQSLAHERIQRYMLEWRHIQAISNGHTLRTLGLPSGPCYGLILKRLRTARLDGEVRDDTGEQSLLQSLIHDKDFCHDDS
jgi:tRNA nucleotidyltransferase (CCA-adding enzyme)